MHCEMVRLSVSTAAESQAAQRNGEKRWLAKSVCICSYYYRYYLGVFALVLCDIECDQVFFALFAFTLDAYLI